MVGLAITISLAGDAKAAPGTALATLVWGAYVVVLALLALRLWFRYLRIKNTEYRLFHNKIEESSYVFRFLGAYNNVANLKQLRQIQSTMNTWFDLWFFRCGSVTLTVSGDQSDFKIKNIYYPSDVRKQVEELAFGSGSVDQSRSAPGEEVG